MCAKFRFSISSRCDDIVAEVKGGNFMPPSGWLVVRRSSGRRVNQAFIYYNHAVLKTRPINERDFFRNTKGCQTQ